MSASVPLFWFGIALCSSAVTARFVPAVAAEQAGTTFRVPDKIFAGEPRGPYATGTFEELWIDSACDDPSTADPHDKRKVMIQIWYPATVPKHPRWAPYAISPQLYGMDHWSLKLAHVRTRSALDAPMPTQSMRFPILVYNHGGGSTHFDGTFLTEFMASQGYVVVSIGHPGENRIKRFPDGMPYENDGEKSEAEAPEGLSYRDRFEYMWGRTDLDLYVKDISFVLDQLEALNTNPRHRFHDRLDVGRVGVLGWSLGGYISLQAARDEPRIKAVVNLDGWPYGLMGPNGAVTRGSERPVLLMFNGSYDGGAPPPRAGGEVDAAEMEVGRAVATYYWTLLRRSTADWYHVVLERAHHWNFSDHALFEAPNPSNLHPRAAHAIINSYVQEFLDKYVRGGRKDTPLLSGQQRFPEATLLRRRRAEIEKDL